VTGEPVEVWLVWSLGALAVLLLVVGVWMWRKGRPFAPGEVFLASRLSSG